MTSYVTWLWCGCSQAAMTKVATGAQLTPDEHKGRLGRSYRCRTRRNVRDDGMPVSSVQAYSLVRAEARSGYRTGTVLSTHSLVSEALGPVDGAKVASWQHRTFHRLPLRTSRRGHIAGVTG